MHQKTRAAIGATMHLVTGSRTAGMYPQTSKCALMYTILCLVGYTADWLHITFLDPERATCPRALTRPTFVLPAFRVSKVYHPSASRCSCAASGARGQEMEQPAMVSAALPGTMKTAGTGDHFTRPGSNAYRERGPGVAMQKPQRFARL
jgi:hypothetical protein